MLLVMILCTLQKRHSLRRKILTKTRMFIGWRSAHLEVKEANLVRTAKTVRTAKMGETGPKAKLVPAELMVQTEPMGMMEKREDEGQLALD